MNGKKLSISVTVVLLLLCQVVFASGTPELGSAEPEEVTLFLLQVPERFPDDAAVTDYVVEQVKEEYGLNFTLDIPTSPADNAESYQMLALRLAAGDIDAWSAVLQSDQQASLDTLLAPLDESIEDYGQNALVMVPAEYWQAAKTADGQTRFLPIAQERVVDKCIWARADIYRELMGREIPQVMRIGELEDFMRAVQSAYPDMIPLGRTATVANFFDRTFLGLGFPEDLMGSDGRPVKYAGINHDNVRYPQLDSYVERLRTLNRWYDEGFIPSEFFTWARQSAIEMTTRGEVAVAVSSAWRARMFEQVRTENNIDMRFVAIVDDNGRGTFRDTSATSRVRSVQVLQSSADKADFVVALFDWGMSSLENAATLTLGIPGTHWKFSDDGSALLPPDPYETFAEFQEQGIYSNFLHNFITRGAWQGEMAAMQFSGSDTSWEFSYNREIPRSAPPDGFFPYSGFDDMVMDRGIRFNDADWGTLLDEVETAAVLGEIPPEEAQRTLLEYLEDNDWDEWWDLRMEMYDAY
jgi:hypothetical protein